MKINAFVLRRAAAAALLAWPAAWMAPVAAQTPAYSPPVVYALTYRYVNKSVNCPTTWSGASADYKANAAGWPEYLCTGIILRATSREKEPDGGWVPEAKSLPDSGRVSAGGMSFSYIRTDAKFVRLAWNFENGFTLYPLQGKYAMPAGKTPYTVLCAFPVDAATDDRANAGCGPSQDLVNSTGGWGGKRVGDTCQNLGLTVPVSKDAPEKDKRIAAGQMADNWYHKSFIYNNDASTAHRGYYYQCGFDMTDGKRGVADFAAVLLGMTGSYQGSSAGTDVNELRIKTWGTDAAASAGVPVESFFYVTGTGGLSNAQYDQNKYYTLTGQFVPIVEMTLPPSMGGDFVFAYHSKDQVVQPTDAYKKQFPSHPTCTLGDFDAYRC